MATPLSRKHLKRAAGWRYSSGAIHAGYDYSVPIGTPVFAVRDGHVLKVVDSVPNLKPTVDGVSGDPPNYVMLAIMFQGKPATVVYLHVSPDVPVKAGEKVKAGDTIALSGHNGHSTGPHLHISVMKGHQHTRPFDYLKGLDNHSAQPNGLASNGLTIFPPTLVYGRAKPTELDRGTIVLADLRFGTKGSATVKRLQRRLNAIHLEGGAELPVTGNYLDRTRAEVVKWQVQKLRQKPGTPGADGNVHQDQAALLFKGSGFTLT